MHIEQRLLGVHRRRAPAHRRRCRRRPAGGRPSASRAWRCSAGWSRRCSPAAPWPNSPCRPPPIALAIVLRGVLELRARGRARHRAPSSGAARRALRPGRGARPGAFAAARTGEVAVTDRRRRPARDLLRPLRAAAPDRPADAVRDLRGWWLDPLIAGVLFRAAWRSWLPALWHRTTSRNPLAPAARLCGLAADFLDSLQGLATLKAFGQSARHDMLAVAERTCSRRTMCVLAMSTVARGITDTSIAFGAAVCARAAAPRGSRRRDGAVRAAGDPDAGRRDVPPDARAARGAAPGCSACRPRRASSALLDDAPVGAPSRRRRRSAAARARASRFE